jgi:hypothetical protein
MGRLNVFAEIVWKAKILVIKVIVVSMGKDRRLRCSDSHCEHAAALTHRSFGVDGEINNCSAVIFMCGCRNVRNRSGFGCHYDRMIVINLQSSGDHSRGLSGTL